MAETFYAVVLQAWDPAIGSIRHLRYSTRGFVTSPTDTPPHTFYDERLEQPAVLTRSIFSEGTTSGRSKAGYGDLVLNNEDGLLDPLLTYGFDGRPVTLIAAHPTGTLILGELTAEQCQATTRSIVIKLRDRQRELDVPLQPTKYAGDNVPPDGLEGGPDDLLGKPKPRCFGQVFNVPAVLVNAAKLIYQVNDGPITALPAVYDRGIQLLPGRPWRLQATPFTMGTGEYVNAVTYGNGLYVSAGEAGALATSPDAVSWTLRTSGFGASDIFGLAYGEGIYVAVGQAGKLYTSPDGTTWTVRTSQFGGDEIRAVTYAAALGIFVAVGANGLLSTSPDGLTWTARTSQMTGAIQGVAFGGTMLAAVSTGGEAASSFDGITWTLRATSLTASSGLVCLAYGNGLFVAGGLNLFATSPDGITWTIVPLTLFSASTYVGLVYGTQFLVLGGAGQMATSEDGFLWTEQADGTVFGGASAIQAGVYNPDDDAYVLVGEHGKIALALPDTFHDLDELEDDTLAPAAGEYTAHLNGGYFRLGAPPAGLITADVTQGEFAGDRTAGRIFSQLLTDPLGAPLVEVSRDDIDALHLANDAVLGLWVGAEELTVAQAADRVAGSVGAWWGVDRNGVFRIQQFTAPSGTPVYAFTANDLLESLERVPVNDPTRGLPVWRSIVRYARNHAVQTTDLAAGVTDDRRAFLAREYREAVDDDVAVQLAHPLAPESIEDVLMTEEADAQAEATRRQALRGVQRDRYRIVGPLDNETEVIDLGQVVTLTHARYGLGAGPSFRVLGVAPDVQRRTLTLELWK